MEFRIISYLLSSEPCTIGDLANALNVSSYYASMITIRLAKKGIVLKRKVGKRVIVKPNMEHSFTVAYVRFLESAGETMTASPIDVFTPKSKRDLLNILGSNPMTIDELEEKTGYSRRNIYRALSLFQKAGIISVSETKVKSYSLNYECPMTKPLVQAVEAFDVKKNMSKNGLAEVQLPLSTHNKTLLHLYSFNEYDRNQIFTQSGISKAVNCGISSVSRILKECEKDEYVLKKRVHVKGGSKKQNMYILTQKGRTYAEELKETVGNTTIIIKDIRGEIKSCEDKIYT